jgi:hypothetical protein
MNKPKIDVWGGRGRGKGAGDARTDLARVRQGELIHTHA